MEINEVCEAVHKTSTEKGFWEDYDTVKKLLPEGSTIRSAVQRAFISQKLMLTVSELSEAMEAQRTNHRADRLKFDHQMAEIEDGDEFAVKTVFENTIKNSIEDELADALIRICDLAGKLGVDLDWHVQRKMEYNGARPYMHGKKF